MWRFISSGLILLLTVFSVLIIGGSAQISAQTTSPKPAVPPPPKVSPTPPEDDPNEDIRIDTELVNLNVRVIDRNNRSINNLKKSDFKVYEDGVLQDVEYLSQTEVPTNYTLVVDNSGSMRFLLEKVIEASKIIIENNKTGDETSIIRFVGSDKIEVLQDFTESKTDLNDAFENMFVEGGQTAVLDAVYLAAEKVGNYKKTRTDQKRRALILVSDGEDRNSFYKEKQILNFLSESDVQVYVIGFTSELSGEGGFISKSPRAKAEALLKRMTEATGGKTYFPKSLDELNGIARDIASELRTQYLVSYTPTDDRRDGTVRNIRVTITDGPNKQKRIAVTRTARSTGADAVPKILPKPEK